VARLLKSVKITYFSNPNPMLIPRMKACIQVVALASLLSLTACNRTTVQKAVAYNDAIVDIQARVVGHFDQFVMSADTGDSLSASAALNVALDSCRANLKRLEAMDGFGGDTRLRDAAIELVKHYTKGLGQEFRGILGVVTNDNATREQLEHANEVRDAFKHEEDRLFEAVEAAQKAMAEKHGFDFQQPPPTP
jgi:uncharacterized protein YdbL (DUF1318 family)